MGVIVLMLTLLAERGISRRSLYLAEAREDKIHPSVGSTVRTMWWIYVTYTLSGTVLLWGVGMSPWAALNHAMTALSTGGFSLSPRSIAGYPGLTKELAILPLMLFGAINFAAHYDMMRSGLRRLWRNYQARWLVLFCLLWSLALFLENLLSFPAGEAARLSYFQAISAATTTGFQTTDILPWSDTAKLILAGAMFVGATAGSTAGGIKVLRTMLLLRGVSWQLRRLIYSPRVVAPFRFGGEIWDEVEAVRRVEAAAVFAFVWAVFLGLGVVVLLHTVPKGFGLADVIFEVASAQGTVGLSMGITHPEMPLLAKLTLCFNMWVGRLEIIPVLMLLRSLFRGIE